MISVSDVEAARERISFFVTETPLEKSRTLSTLLGTNVYLKLELFQKTGSFKPRGPSIRSFSSQVWHEREAS